MESEITKCGLKIFLKNPQYILVCRLGKSCMLAYIFGYNADIFHIPKEAEKPLYLQCVSVRSKRGRRQELETVSIYIFFFKTSQGIVIRLHEFS